MVESMFIPAMSFKFSNVIITGHKTTPASDRGRRLAHRTAGRGKPPPRCRPLPEARLFSPLPRPLPSISFRFRLASRWRGLGLRAPRSRVALRARSLLMAAPHPDKLEGGVGLAPPAPGPPPPPLPPPPGSLATGPGRKQGKAGLQMKSPEKKRRKSNTQGPSYSHLSEFAPPPTPMVDHLVASNPFEDDFAIPKVGSSSALLGNRDPPNFACKSCWAPVPPSYGGGPQPMRRQPPPFGPNQMGPAFNMAPQNPAYVQPAGDGLRRATLRAAAGTELQPLAGKSCKGPWGRLVP
ncbi:hypothetical protein E2320_013932 [Naja naja]|nr:hypothetical protein E2320_013932 [Naja naja]